MWVLWPNVTIFLGGGVVLATLIFIIYGLIKGFDNVFPEEKK
ncbi:MAG: hypothetical protein AB1641_09555 [Thermodesulfobacteriota bacterium]